MDFPEIAVVGQESTGKSSVLERITVRKTKNSSTVPVHTKPRLSQSLPDM